MYLKIWGEFGIKTNIFRKLIQFSSKHGAFMDALPLRVYSRGLRPLQPPELLSVFRAAQRVNDEPIKVLNLLFFAYFFWNLAEAFEKLQFLTFGPKQCFYLTHSATEYFEKLAFTKKKQKKRNFKRLYLKS